MLAYTAIRMARMTASRPLIAQACFALSLITDSSSVKSDCMSSGLLLAAFQEFLQLLGVVLRIVSGDAVAAFQRLIVSQQGNAGIPDLLVLIKFARANQTNL